METWGVNDIYQYGTAVSTVRFVRWYGSHGWRFLLLKKLGGFISDAHADATSHPFDDGHLRDCSRAKR